MAVASVRHTDTAFEGFIDSLERETVPGWTLPSRKHSFVDHGRSAIYWNRNYDLLIIGSSIDCCSPFRAFINAKFCTVLSYVL